MVKKVFEVAILIPHYNDTTGLLRTLHSIQYDGQLIIVVVDDGSKMPPSIEWLKENCDFKIRLVNLQENNGIEHALNYGLACIEKEQLAEYVARIDCGDVAYPDRFMVQKKYLDEHPDVGLIGSWVRFLDDNGNYLYTLKFPVKHKEIVKKIPLSVPFTHPTVMFRLSIAREVGYYPKDYEAVEDYAFFYKMIEVTKVANLPVVLLDTVRSVKGISILKRRVQLKNRRQLLLKYWKWNGYYLIGFGKVILLQLLPLDFLESIKRKWL